MKYSQYSRKSRKNGAFYIVIALCLIVIGMAAWFGFTKINSEKPKDNLSSMDQSFESSMKEYTDDTPSYNNSENNIINFTEEEPTNEEVKDQEYVSKPETVKEKAYSMPVNGEILKDFSTTTLQYSSTFGDMRIHAAVDIACSEGTLISAVSDGRVTDIETTADFGKCITIDHGDNLVIKYCGLKNVTCEKDTAVSMGDSIGAVGAIPAECADKSHLHIEAYESGKAVSILKFFP